MSLLVALSEIAGRNSVKLSRRVKTDRVLWIAFKYGVIRRSKAFKQRCDPKGK